MTPSVSQIWHRKISPAFAAVSGRFADSVSRQSQLPIPRQLSSFIHTTSTNRSRPKTCDTQVRSALPLPVHGKANGQCGHAKLAHGISGLASQKSAIDRWTDDDDSALAFAVAAILVEMRQTGLHSAIEAFRVDLLHQLEALHRRVLNTRPPDGTAVI